MQEQEESSFEERLQNIGVEFRRSPDPDPYKGFLSLKGPTDVVVGIITLMPETGGGYKGKKFRSDSISKEIVKSFSRMGDSSIDIDIMGEDGQIHMVRVIGYTLKDGAEISFGGGGNITLFSDMEKAVNASVNNYFKNH